MHTPRVGRHQVALVAPGAVFAQPVRALVDSIVAAAANQPLHQFAGVFALEAAAGVSPQQAALPRFSACHPRSVPSRHAQPQCAGMQLVASTLVALHRTASVICLRELQLTVAATLAHVKTEDDKGREGEPAGRIPMHEAPINSVHDARLTLQAKCKAAFLPQELNTQLQPQRAPASAAVVASLQLPVDGTGHSDDDLILEESDAFTNAEMEALMVERLGMPRSLLEHKSMCMQSTSRARLVQDALLAQRNPDPVKDACAPHGALAGYAKCATSTLQYGRWRGGQGAGPCGLTRVGVHYGVGSAWLLLHPEIVVPWSKEPNYDFADRASAGGQKYLQALFYGQQQSHAGIKWGRPALAHLLAVLVLVVARMRACP